MEGTSNRGRQVEGTSNRGRQVEGLQPGGGTSARVVRWMGLQW